MGSLNQSEPETIHFAKEQGGPACSVSLQRPVRCHCLTDESYASASPLWALACGVSPEPQPGSRAPKLAVGFYGFLANERQDDCHCRMKLANVQTAPPDLKFATIVLAWPWVIVSLAAASNKDRRTRNCSQKAVGCSLGHRVNCTCWYHARGRS